MSIRSVGTMRFSDDDADYYGGIERLSDRATFGVYQPVTFRDPETGLAFVGKPHSFWWSKTDHEFQVEMQVYPYVPRNARILSNPGALIELYSTHGDMMEIPASHLLERLSGKFVHVPPGVAAEQIAAFVRDAPPEYHHEDADPEEESDRAEQEAVEDEDDNRSHFFYKYALRPGADPAPSLPPKFHDAWSSFANHSLTKRRFWQHDFTQMIKREYLAALLGAMDKHAPTEEVFFSVVTDAYEVDGSSHVRWAVGGPRRAVGVDGMLQLARVKAFLSTLTKMHRDGADSTTAYACCCEFLGGTPKLERVREVGTPGV